jgi:hypothetical protein
MKSINLNGKWTMVYGTTEEKGILCNKELEKRLLGKSFKAMVPTTMYEVLEDNNAIDDPFFGENESKYTELSNISCSFKRDFNISNKEINNDVITQLTHDFSLWFYAIKKKYKYYKILQISEIWRICETEILNLMPIGVQFIPPLEY